MKQQFDLPQSEEVFNLASETAQDPWRIERERIAAEERRQQSAEYQRKMQLTLMQCPGFYSCDAPSSDESKGRVTIYPSQVSEAAIWLKRRFHTSENLELSHGDALVFEIAPRIRRVTPGKPRRKVSFDRAVQYELAFA